MDYSLTVRGPRLIREIGRPRTDSGLSMDTAASRLDWSKSKLYRIEAGPTRGSAPTTWRTCRACTGAVTARR